MLTLFYMLEYFEHGPRRKQLGPRDRLRRRSWPHARRGSSRPGFPDRRGRDDQGARRKGVSRDPRQLRRLSTGGTAVPPVVRVTSAAAGAHPAPAALKLWGSVRSPVCAETKRLRRPSFMIRTQCEQTAPESEGDDESRSVRPDVAAGRLCPTRACRAAGSGREILRFGTGLCGGILSIRRAASARYFFLRQSL